MRDTLLRRYHALPPVLRSVAASARGGYLRAWRYGPGARRLRDDALERDRWSPARWHAWQEERLAVVLHRAATRVPYYRDQWAARRRVGDRAAWDVLAHWPVLEKAALRRAPEAFVADDRVVRRMFHDHTSGTTGTSLDLWFARDTVRAWYALHEARARAWYGVTRDDRWAMIGGQLVAPAAQDAPPFWVWNAALHQLYLSAYHLAPRHAPAYAAALGTYRVAYLLGYPSAAHALARELVAAGRPGPRLRVVVANAEPVFAHQREAVAGAFGCPLRETYGQAEAVAAASECEHGRLHLWPEAGWLEVLDPAGQAVGAGRSGEFVATSLLNADMPLVRYRVGDRGAVAPPNGEPVAAACACGRGLPVLAGVEGRTDDVLYTRDGRAVGRLDPVFKARMAVREAQIVQETLGRVRVRYVPADDYSAADGAGIAARLRERLGDVDVVLEAVDAVPRTPNGKFRAVVCALSAEERTRLAGGGGS